MAERLDLDLIAKLLGVAGSSAHEGEARNAICMVDKKLKAADMVWPDLVAPFRQNAIAVEAARVLLAENTEMRAEIDRLRAENSRGAEIDRLRAENSRGAAVTIWHEVGAKVASTSSAARWALEQHAAGGLWLSEFEVNFLRTCSRWVGRLTPNQQPIFQQIMDRIVERTGLTPPP